MFSEKDRHCIWANVLLYTINGSHFSVRFETGHLNWSGNMLDLESLVRSIFGKYFNVVFWNTIYLSQIEELLMREGRFVRMYRCIQAHVHDCVKFAIVGQHLQRKLFCPLPWRRDPMVWFEAAVRKTTFAGLRWRGWGGSFLNTCM